MRDFTCVYFRKNNSSQFLPNVGLVYGREMKPASPIDLKYKEIEMVVVTISASSLFYLPGTFFSNSNFLSASATCVNISAAMSQSYRILL